MTEEKPHPHWQTRQRIHQDPATVEDAITIRWTGTDATPRRLVFEPRSVGGHTRIEQRWSGDEWVTEGQEIVSRVGLDAPAAVVVDGEPTLGD